MKIDFFLLTNLHSLHVWRNYLSSVHTKGLVPVTSREDKSHCVNWPVLLQNLVAGTRVRLVTQIQTNFWDKSLRLVPQNASCELFVGQVPEISPLVSTLQGASCRE